MNLAPLLANLLCTFLYVDRSVNMCSIAFANKFQTLHRWQAICLGRVWFILWIVTRHCFCFLTEWLWNFTEKINECWRMHFWYEFSDEMSLVQFPGFVNISDKSVPIQIVANRLYEPMNSSGKFAMFSHENCFQTTFFTILLVLFLSPFSTEAN